MKQKKRSKNNSIDEPYSLNSWKDISKENLVNVLRYNRYAQMLIFLILVGGILRFYNLGYNSLWLDEGVTYDFAKLSLVEIVQLTTNAVEVNSPLFYALEHCMLIFGNSEFILRFLSALFGTLTIPVVYLIGRDVCGRLGGIVAAALLAFSTFHVYYSQEARAYATVLFFFSLALLFYLHALKGNKLQEWCLCGIFCAFSFWSHFYASIGVGILFLHALIVKRHEILKHAASLKPFIIGWVLSLLLVSPLLYGTIQLYFMRTATAPTWGISGFDVFTQTIVLFSGSEIYLTVLFLFCALLGVGYLYLKAGKQDIALLLVMSLTLPFFASMSLSSLMPMSPRYLLYLLPLYFIAIGAAFNLIPKEIDYKKVAVVVIILIILVGIPYFSSYYTTYSKNDWRIFSQDLSSKTSLGDYVVAMPGYMTLPLDYYYDSNADGVHEMKANSAIDLERIEQERGNATVYYVVTADIYAANPNGDALAWLDSHTQYAVRTMGINLFQSV